MTAGGLLLKLTANGTWKAATFPRRDLRLGIMAAFCVPGEHGTKMQAMGAAAILAMEENFFIRKDTTVSHSVPLLQWKAIPLTEMGSCVLEGLGGVERMEMHGGLPRVCGTELDDIESRRA